MFVTGGTQDDCGDDFHGAEVIDLEGLGWWACDKPSGFVTPAHLHPSFTWNSRPVVCMEENICEIYDLETDEWDFMPGVRMITPRTAPKAVQINETHAWITGDDESDIYIP